MKTVTSAPAIGVLLSLASLTALGAEEAPEYNTFELTPFAGYMFGGEFEDATTGDDLDLDEDTSYGLIFNIAADQHRHYEFLYTVQSTALDGATPLDMDVQYLQLGGTVSHPDMTRVIPYFGLTVGAARFEPDAAGYDSETRLAFSAGGGVRVPVTDHIGVRFDARAYFTLLDSDGDIFCVSSAGATCATRAKSDTFVQYAASLGVVIGF